MSKRLRYNRLDVIAALEKTLAELPKRKEKMLKEWQQVQLEKAKARLTEFNIRIKEFAKDPNRDLSVSFRSDSKPQFAEENRIKTVLVGLKGNKEEYVLLSPFEFEQLVQYGKWE